MKITEITPPVERKFSIVVNETELQHLTLIVGRSNSMEIRDLVEKDLWRTTGFRDFVYDPNLAHPLYNTLLEAARS